MGLGEGIDHRLAKGVSRPPGNRDLALFFGRGQGRFPLLLPA